MTPKLLRSSHGDSCVHRGDLDDTVRTVRTVLVSGTNCASTAGGVAGLLGVEALKVPLSLPHVAIHPALRAPLLLQGFIRASVQGLLILKYKINW